MFTKNKSGSAYKEKMVQSIKPKSVKNHGVALFHSDNKLLLFKTTLSDAKNCRIQFYEFVYSWLLVFHNIFIIHGL